MRNELYETLYEQNVNRVYAQNNHETECIEVFTGITMIYYIDLY